jgi:hypothetical protein
METIKMSDLSSLSHVPRSSFMKRRSGAFGVFPPRQINILKSGICLSMDNLTEYGAGMEKRDTADLVLF